jgi:hypothetical protein
MQEALELVCRKRKLDPRDYALLLGDMSILIPLDRTVASLQGKRELVIVKRSMLPQLGVDVVRGTGRTTDPNASIFKRISEVPEIQSSSALDFITAAYKVVSLLRTASIHSPAPRNIPYTEKCLCSVGKNVHLPLMESTFISCHHQTRQRWSLKIRKLLHFISKA